MTRRAFDSATEDVTAAVAVPAGHHILYVRGRDSLGNWGVLSSVLVSGWRRRRPDHNVPDPDPPAHQRYGYGGRRRSTPPVTTPPPAARTSRRPSTPSTAGHARSR